MAHMDKAANEELWAGRIAEWRASGLTSAEFCKGREFTAGGLRNWDYVLKQRRKGSAKAARPMRFLRVARPAAAPSPTPPLSLLVELGPARMAVPAGFDPATLRAAITALADAVR